MASAIAVFNELERDKTESFQYRGMWIMKCLDQKPITKLALTDFMARVKYNLVDGVSADLGPATHSSIGV